MYIAAWTIFVIVVIGAVIGLWFLIRFLASRNGAQGVGMFAMIVGAIGIIVSLFGLVGYASADTVVLSGAIVFGCGAIAIAIGKKKE